jgi:hypothetical protein
MNAPLHPEVLHLLEASPQAELPLASQGVLRYVWQGRFGSMLIEIVDGVAFVNGDRVDPIDTGPSRQP